MTPRVVLITGSPGSGKTVLGRELAAELRLPFIARDEVRGGMLFTQGAWTPQLEQIPSKEDAVEGFLSVVEHMLALGISCIVEYVVRSNRPEDFERLRAAGECRIIMVRCVDPLARFAERHRTEPLVSQPAVLSASGFADADAHTEVAVERMRQVIAEMCVEFPDPMLTVETTGDIDPSIETILEFVTR